MGNFIKDLYQRYYLLILPFVLSESATMDTFKLMYDIE